MHLEQCFGDATAIEKRLAHLGQAKHRLQSSLPHQIAMLMRIQQLRHDCVLPQEQCAVLGQLPRFGGLTASVVPVSLRMPSAVVSTVRLK